MKKFDRSYCTLLDCQQSERNRNELRRAPKETQNRFSYRWAKIGPVQPYQPNQLIRKIFIEFSNNCCSKRLCRTKKKTEKNQWIKGKVIVSLWQLYSSPHKCPASTVVNNKIINKIIILFNTNHCKMFSYHDNDKSDDS